ncbi:MAG: hypothetical protein OXI33_05275, partial [Chloroflexota bacterium]|nr:hypothetical protein [Chloroflexota bacterium]
IQTELTPELQGEKAAITEDVRHESTWFVLASDQACRSVSHIPFFMVVESVQSFLNKPQRRQSEHHLRF